MDNIQFRHHNVADETADASAELKWLGLFISAVINEIGLGLTISLVNIYDKLYMPIMNI